MSDDGPDQDGFDGVMLFLGLLGAGILVLVAVLYGLAWLVFDSGN